MTVIATVNPSALLAPTATAPTATAPTATAPTATAPTATAPTATAPTATAFSTTFPRFSPFANFDVSAPVNRYSMFEYYEIVEKAFIHFFNDTIYGFDPMPKFSKKKIAEMKEEAESLFDKERFEEITERDIDIVACDYADIMNIEPWELEEMGWAFIEEIAKRLCISPILLIESETYLRWAYAYFY